MYFPWLATAVQQGVNAVKKYREKNAPVLPPHFTPPPISESPIPTPESCTYVYHPSPRIARIINASLWIASGVGLILLIIFANSRYEGLVATSSAVFFFGWFFGIFSLAAYRKIKGTLFCVGKDGLISKSPPLDPLIARWSEIFEISAGENERLGIELWDRSTYKVDCPNQGRKETVKMMRAYLPQDRYEQAEQRIRQWEMEIND